MTGLLPLTVLEEFLLLALDDETGDFYDLPRSTLDCASAGAVLMDLMLRRRIDNDLKNMFVTDVMPTGDDILDPVLQLMSLSPVMTPQAISTWLQELIDQADALREKALRRLGERGIIRREDKKILWVFGARRYPVVHDKEVREVKLRILGVILGDEIPAPHDIMLVGLADACDLFRYLLNSHQFSEAAPRIAHVARMDLIGQAVAKAVTEIEAAIAMASGFR